MPIAYAIVLALIPLAVLRVALAGDRLTRYVGSEAPLRFDIRSRLLILLVFWYFGVVYGAYHHASQGNWRDAIILPALLGGLVALIALGTLDQPRLERLISRGYRGLRPRMRAWMAIAFVVVYTGIFAGMAVMLSGITRYAAVIAWVLVLPSGVMLIRQQWRQGR